MNPNLHVFNSPKELAHELADKLLALLAKHLHHAFHIALSGGKTPNLLFTALADKYAVSSVWKDVHFWWVDERMVPPYDPESNYGTAQELLFSRINIPKENVHRIKGENHPHEEALSYSQQIRDSLPVSDGWPVFDLILLGIGDDGHTASIFPDQLHLLQSDQICEVAIHPQSKQKRITLTGQTMNASSKIWFVVTGANKAEKLKAIATNSLDSDTLPAAHIKPINGELVWYADQEAAKHILVKNHDH